MRPGSLHGGRRLGRPGAAGVLTVALVLTAVALLGFHTASAPAAARSSGSTTCGERTTKHVACAPPAGVRLDLAFGDRGRLIAPFSYRTWGGLGRVAVVLDDDGNLVLSNGRVVKRFDSAGDLDNTFGRNGNLIPPRSDPPFEVLDLAVDSKNRLLVAGNSVLPEEEFPPSIYKFPPDNYIPADVGPTAARISRYLPAGTPDRTFGEGGSIETNLGLPPPVGKPRANPPAFGRPTPETEMEQQLLGQAWVETTGIAVDAQDRLILTGGASASLHFWCFHDWSWNTLTDAAFVARFSDSGVLDPSFGGGDGVFGGHRTDENPLSLELSSRPTIGPTGEIFYTSAATSVCPPNSGSAGVGRLSEAGDPDASFGTRGAIFTWITDTAIDRDGSAVVLKQMPGVEGERHLAYVERFLPNGLLDQRFGRSGRATLRIPGEPDESGATSVAIDRNGDILVGGVMTTHRRLQGRQRQPRIGYRSRWLLSRIRSTGRFDRSLGRISTGFGRLEVGGPRVGLRAGPEVLLDPQGRAVMTGQYRGSLGDHGLVVARYRLGE
jgi:hypothetical protein